MIASILISQIGDLPLDTVYLQNVVARHRYFSLTNGMAFVIADCSKIGQLNSRYCLLEKLTFSSTNSDCKCTVMVCSCDHGLEQKHRLAATSREVSEQLDDFHQREVGQYCIHLRTALKLDSTEFNVHSISSDETIDSDPFVDILSTSPFLAAVYDGSSYGLVSCTQAAARKFKCSHCHSHPTCDHISFLQDWCDVNDLSDDLFPQVFHSSQELEPYKSISYVRIPYPLPDDLKKVHDALESGEQRFPIHLIPNQNSGMCSHGHK